MSEPALGEAQALAARNHADLSDAAVPVQGKTLAALRRWARREALRTAREYTASLFPGESQDSFPAAAPDADRTTLFVSGHQPAPFHAGVWIKNFIIDQLAQQSAGIGVNLVVDNDAMTSTAVVIPAGRRAPRPESVPFDAPRPTEPWEEARLIDRRMFSTFAERAGRALGEWGVESLLPEYWSAAVAASERGAALVECLTAARHRWERGWGARNLELPLSRLCQTEPCLWLTAHLLAHLPRFHRIYNEVLREYRALYRLRSRTHPVSDLREDSGWLEAPFWIWRAGASGRGRVFARQFAHELRLSDGRNEFAALPLTPGKDACCAVEALARISTQGWRLRTRALTTTLFSRLCFADLFVHGLGGAKYDEMTDRLISRFFGVPAPGYLMVSGTLRLPLDAHPVHRSDELRLRRQLRELNYHSEKHQPPSPAADIATLIAEKQRLIVELAAGTRDELNARGPAAREPGAGYARFRRFQDINQRLAQSTMQARARLEQELTATQQQLAANAVLMNRNYAAFLQPADRLKHFIDHVCSFVRS